MPIDISQLSRAAMEAHRNDAYAKAQALVDEARKKTPTGEDLYNYLGDDYDRVKGYLADCDLLEAGIARADEIDGMDSRIKAAFAPASASAGPAMYGGGKSEGGSYGSAFVKSDNYARMYERTDGFRHMDEFNRGDEISFTIDRSPLSGRKALITSGSAVGGAFVVPYYDLGYEPVARPSPSFVDMVSRVTVDTDTVNWVRQDTRSTVATGVAEASNSTGTTGTKPETTIAFSRQVSPAETIAVVAAVTERELADASQMRAVIDEDLRDDVLIQLDSQLLTGSGSTPILTGVLNAGIQTVACTTAFTNALDCMLRAQVVIMTANEPAPDGTILNPLDWEPMRTAKASTSGEYLWGVPGDALMQSLWGLPVLITNQLTANTGLVGAFKRACRLYDREQVRVTVGWINDDFARNILRVRMEMRAAFAVRRPSAIARVTGI